MPDSNDDKTLDKTVKELLDGATRADLERWFGLPSFEQLAEQGIVPEPPPPANAEMVERRKRQDEALAAVDPVWIEAHRRRTDAGAEVIRPLPPLPLRVDPGIAQFDTAMLEQRSSIADPREVERPEDVADALQETTPQALLRDLHRPEADFYKAFEWVDPLGEARIDLSASTRDAMRLPPAMPPRSSATPLQEVRTLLLELRAERHRPWIELEIPQRRVTE